MRPLAFVAALVAAVLIGVGGASAVVGGSGRDTPHGPELLQPDGSGAAISAAVPDPAGHQPWAVRVYRSVAGLTCPEVGRTQDGGFGQVDQHGDFRPNDIEAAGSCTDLDKAPMSVVINHYPTADGRGARAVVFGVVSPAVKAVELRLAGGARPLSIGKGSFLAVTTEDELAGAAIVATMTDGSTKSYELRPTTMPAREQPSPES